jgi:hypothetical protein
MHAIHPNEPSIIIHDVRNSSPFLFHNLLRFNSSSLASLRRPCLGLLVSLDGPLALADSTRAGDGVFAKVGAVVALGGGVDDGGD